MNNRLLPFLVLYIITTSFCHAQNPTLLGTTVYGGQKGVGSIFQTNNTGSAFNKDFSFYFSQLSHPSNSVMQAGNGLLYGTTEYGGANDLGMIFSYNIISGTVTDIHDFGIGTDGQNPYGSLILANNSLLYGMTSGGGTNGEGTIFNYNINTSTETITYSFGRDSADGQNPYGSLFELNDSIFYGMTKSGGLYGDGTIFVYNINSDAGDTDIVIHNFGTGTDGQNPYGSLILASDGNLYGMTAYGGAYSSGVIFNYDISTATETVLWDFGYTTDGQNPLGSLIQVNNNLLYGMTEGGGANGDGIIFNYDISTITETDVYDFGGDNDGQSPKGSLIESTNNGLLYGTTDLSGASGEGTIFSYNTTTSTETDIHDFGSGTDGQFPNGTLFQANNDSLYGMTDAGGANNAGTIFSYNTNGGTVNDIHNFGKGAVGQYPYGSLLLASNGLLYGMTRYGGANVSSINGGGTIYSYNIFTDVQSDIHDFGSDTDGQSPYGSLIQANNGLLYGMTEQGGTNDSGIIFSYNILTGKDSVLHNFGSSTDGRNPYGSLIQLNDSLLYGMTRYGGVNDSGIIFSYNILTGKDSDLHDFGSSTDGKNPYGSLIQANNGLLYGMTYSGGTNDSGTIFSYNILTGKDSVLHNFGSGTADGQYPYGSLIQASDTLLFGMTYSGGANGEGIIFSYNISTGVETDVHDFGSGNDGYNPKGSLMQASDGLLYGMTYAGGANGAGMVFSFNIDSGTETDVQDFAINNGQNPYGSLIEDDAAASDINQLSINNNQLSIFPNPTSGQFTIKLKGNQTGYSMEVYNMMGENIYQSVLSNTQNTINLSSHPAGMYFIYLKSQQGVEVGKVVLTK
jgi:uncharacterized repeat protein (TIGR03803 family)